MIGRLLTIALLGASVLGAFHFFGQAEHQTSSAYIEAALAEETPRLRRLWQ